MSDFSNGLSANQVGAGGSDGDGGSGTIVNTSEQSPEILEVGGETSSGSVYGNSESDRRQNEVEFGLEVPRGQDILPVVGESSPVYIERRNRWVEELGHTELRRRILHDICPQPDEKATLECFRKLQRRVTENSRGSGACIIAAHLAGGRSHLHIVHDCVWSSTSCKCWFLRGIIVKPRKAKFNPYFPSAAYWRNLIDYLFGRGGRYVFILYVFYYILIIYI